MEIKKLLGMKMFWNVTTAMVVLFSPAAYSQVIAPEGTLPDKQALTKIVPVEPLLEYRVVSQETMDAWPVDRRRDGTKLWAETTWGGDTGYRKLFNWNIWPNRLVFRVDGEGEVARGEAFWRRSGRSIRLRGLKLLSAATGEEITDARLVNYDQERVALEFRPAAGPGEYYLYFAAREEQLFDPSDAWLEKTEEVSSPVPAKPLRIEARCEIDSFYPMEVIALEREVDRLFVQFPRSPYLVVPEDRDRSIKMLHEIPAAWVHRNPAARFIIGADRNEYRVFQVGIWACREGLDDVELEFSDFRAPGGAVIPADLFQCLTLTSKIASEYIEKPSELYPVPLRQVRALWCGIDLPAQITQGEYAGTITVRPANLPLSVIPVTVKISPTTVKDRGDHDLWRLSRLRWIESDIGLSDRIFPPYEALELDPAHRTVSTWGHTVVIDEAGLPGDISFGGKDILAAPVEVRCRFNGREVEWAGDTFRFTTSTDARVSWSGSAASSTPLKLEVEGRIDFDGCIEMTVRLAASAECRVEDVRFTIPWRKEHAGLAAGMGYRGRRLQDRIWRSVPRERSCFAPSLWLGSVEAGLGFITWDTGPWEDASRMDAARVTEQGDRVEMRLNLGSHTISPDKSWSIHFALRPTPVKPVDQRHWQFRYLHRGGGFQPGDNDTPQSYLKDNCKRLDELVGLGVKRLNLHDWWGPCFNYAWQWEGPDNLSRLTGEAHKRGILVKCYNSGRELSTFAPEFWVLVYEGSHYRFPNELAPEPKGSFQDAWHENHLPDGLPQGWPRLHRDRGNEHAVPVSNATRNGNFYLESMRYMTENFGTDGAYWDGADGSTLGHREIARRLWTIFREANPDAAIDVHHGTTLLNSTMSTFMLVLPFIDSLWHGEGFPYDMFDPWEWLVEVSGIPFGIPSEMLSGEQYLDRGMLFGIWPRMGWGAGTEKQQKLWAFFDRFGIENAEMHGWWERNNGITVDRPGIYVTAFTHPENGTLLVVSSWHPPLQHWVGFSIDTSLALDRDRLGLPQGDLRATDILTGEELDITRPMPLKMPREKVKSQFFEYRSLMNGFEGRLIWVRK